MNYIGSKKKLVPFIIDSVKDTYTGELRNAVFCDLFAGTGIVGSSFKQLVNKVISNDIELYSYILNMNYIGNTEPFEYEALLNELNFRTNEEEGLIFKLYCTGSGSGRMYFSDTNGRLIDGIRQKIERWYLEKRIKEGQYFFLLASLIEAADKVANTASVYGAFLKTLKLSAHKRVYIEPALFQVTKQSNEIHRTNSNELIKRISGNILYIDPPYNARQYGANYHVLNTIAEYKEFTPKGATGLREYYKSNYCSKATVKDDFENIISMARFSHIYVSYNNEGLMKPNEIREIMSQYGDYSVIEKDYQRFRADSEKNRNHRASSTTEYLHILRKINPN